jgi:hypothetical protein
VIVPLERRAGVTEFCAMSGFWAQGDSAMQTVTRKDCVEASDTVDRQKDAVSPFSAMAGISRQR